jgi:guanosine-3',5'-bis(diphosphate) 3'-pyrophosphohydrolase
VERIHTQEDEVMPGGKEAGLYSERLERAITLALRAHGGQVRKLDPETPYAAHPVHVAFMVREAGGSEDCVIAALLHDVLEDSPMTAEDLEASFGPRVRDIVLEVSENKALSWTVRKANIVASLGTASSEACLVAAADKTHNLETLAFAHHRLGPSVWKRFRADPPTTLRFHEEVLAAVQDRITERLRENYVRALEAVRRIVPQS